MKDLKNFEKISLFTNTNYERLNIQENFDEIDFLFEYRRLIEINNVHFTFRKRSMNLSLNVETLFRVMKNVQFN